MSITRIYKVSEKSGDGRVWLVDAPSQSSAQACVARTLLGSEIAKPKEVMALMRDGVTVLDAQAEPAAA